MQGQDGTSALLLPLLLSTLFRLCLRGCGFAVVLVLVGVVVEAVAADVCLCLCLRVCVSD